MHKPKKSFRFYIILSVLFVAFLSFIPNALTPAAKDYSQDIAREILRFHVIANSDDPQDQALKLKVKTALTDYIGPQVENMESVDLVKSWIEQNMAGITELAEQTLQENGSDYTVKAQLANCYFPVKTYGDLTFPNGYYDALRVEIGEARGKNWWCVMYPPLCFVDATCAVVPQESKDTLANMLGDDAFQSLSSTQKQKPKIKLKLLEVIQGDR